MPELQDLWSEVRQERGDEVVVLCIDRGDSAKVVGDYWKKHGFGMTPVLQRGTEACDAFGVQSFPTNLVIGPDGTVLYRGAGWNPGALRKVLLPERRDG